MKTTETLSGSYDSWTGGRLRPARRSVYAQYFVKFIQAMQAEGISIYAVTPQNEPLNKGNCASLYMPWEDEAPFVRVLAGAFHKAGLTTKIYLYDHNYDYSGISSQNDYPVHIYNQLGSNFDGADLIAGAPIMTMVEQVRSFQIYTTKPQLRKLSFLNRALAHGIKEMSSPIHLYRKCATWYLGQSIR